MHLKVPEHGRKDLTPYQLTVDWTSLLLYGYVLGGLTNMYCAERMLYVFSRCVFATASLKTEASSGIACTSTKGAWPRHFALEHMSMCRFYFLLGVAVTIPTYGFISNVPALRHTLVDVRDWGGAMLVVEGAGAPNL